MGHIVEVPQPYNFDDIVATKGVGYKPDFRILTSGIESDRTQTNLVHMIGSSTEKDLQGDTMSVYALQSMTKAAPDLTVWLNHNYDLPDSMFGSLTQTPRILQQNGIADLHLEVDVEFANPAATRVKTYIDNGRRLGCSIGCMVTKFEIDESAEDTETWGMPPILIHDVYVVEYSVVGIPANQRSWVENAIRGVFQRTLDPALAPAMKSLWPFQYRDMIKQANGVISKAHLKALEDAPARKKPDSRLDWIPETKNFVLTHKGFQKTLERSQVESLLQGVVNMDGATPAKNIVDVEVQEVKSGIPNEVNPHGMTDNGGYDTDGDIDNGGDIINSNGPMDKEGKIMLHSDGLNHDAVDCQHTHTHNAFGWEGETEHSHLHTHVNDNNHNHSHPVAMAEGEKHMKPEKQASAAPARATNKDGSEGVLLKDAVGNHENYKGVHTHHHDSFGHGDTDMHVHEHFHSDDNMHQHDHSHTPMGEQADGYWSADPDKKAELDSVRSTFLASYNSVGKTLGLPEVTPEMLLRAEHPATKKDIDPAMLMQLQNVHDTIANATGGLVCANAGNIQQMANEAKEQTGSDVTQQMNVLNALGEKIHLFAKSFEHFDVLAVKKEAEDTKALVLSTRKHLDTLLQEVDKANTTLANLKNMPVGNPLHQSRSTHADDSVAMRDDLLGITNNRKSAEPIAHDSLSQAFALTEVKADVHENGQVMTQRHWPDGVGGSVATGVRPPLSAKHMQFMDWADIVAYREGKSAKVPYLGNQVTQ